MIRANWKRQFCRLTVLTGLSALLVAAPGRTVRADDDEGANQRLIGAWLFR